MATHSSIPAWRIPWTEEPGGLQSMGVTESDTTEHTHSVQICNDLDLKDPLHNRVFIFMMLTSVGTKTKGTHYRRREAKLITRILYLFSMS